MKFNHALISGMGVEFPSIKKTSLSLEEDLIGLYDRLKVSPGRLELMTGITERGLWEPGTPPSSISTLAGKKALEDALIDPSEIDLLIHSGVCRDFLEPATASVIHQNLKLKSACQIFDLSNACLGFLNSIVVASQMIETGLIKHALIVTGENSGPLIKQTIHKLTTDPSLTRKDLKKYFANLTIGSAGAAMVISHKDTVKKDAPKILGGSILTDSSANHLCRGDGNIHDLTMETDSEELMHYGLRLAKNNFDLFLENLKITRQDIHAVLTHQVGIAHEKLSLESVGLSEKKTHRTYPLFGNTGSAALPITLIDGAQKNQFQKDELIALLGIGSGLSSIMLGISWNQ